MAIIDGLTTVQSVKNQLKIPSSVTIYDALIEDLINLYSSAICQYLGRTLKRTTHTDEVYTVNNYQYIYLEEYPVQSISAVKLQDVALVLNTDFYTTPTDLAVGRIYKPDGWFGRNWARGTFPDAFCGARDIKVSYISGYYLPADVGYQAGASASLPLGLQMACNNAICTKYLKLGTEGLKQLTEGGLSYTWFDPKENIGGFDLMTAGMLNQYKRVSV